MKDSFFQKNGLFFAVLSLLLIFWLVIVMSIAPVHAASLEDLPSKLKPLPEGEFNHDYVLIIHHELSYGSETLYVFESDPGIYCTGSGNIGFKNDVSYEYWKATDTWSNNGSWSNYRKWDSTTTIGNSGYIYLNQNGAAVSYSTMDIYNSDGSELYYENDLSPDNSGNIGSGDKTEDDELTDKEDQEEDNDDSLVASIIDPIKDFFTWLFSPILELVKNFAEWWETTTAFWESLDISSIGDLWNRLGDVTIAPVEDFFGSLNMDAILAFMQVWEFDMISHLVIAVVAILLVGGVIKLCMSL